MDGEITAAELDATLEEDPPLLVDIRNPASFARVRIPGSVNLPLAELSADVTRFDGEDHVVTVCPHGKASVRAARLIGSYEGFDGRVESLAGGLEGWDGRVDRGSPGETEVATSDSRGADASGGRDAPF